MSAAQPQVYRAPFDAVARRYDETFTSSRIGRAQRSAVWQELEEAFRARDRVLEIGCGTGVDACFLAQRGIRVLASDASPQMIEVTRRRIEERGLERMVTSRVLRADDIGTLPSDQLFDGAFSNFGVLNCVEDLRQLARNLSGVLKLRANVILCWMGPYCVWEMIWYLTKRSRSKAFRRLRRNGVTATLAQGVSLRVHYPSIRVLRNAFAPEFKLKSVQGIGVCVPPSYMEEWAVCHPRLIALFEQADQIFGRCPGFRILGDHVLVRLQRRNAAPMVAVR